MELGIKKLMGTRILVEEETPKQETPTGIIIPDSEKEKPTTGVIVMVGIGTKDEEMVVEVGDKILYSRHAGTEIKVKGKNCKMLLQSDIAAVLED